MNIGDSSPANVLVAVKGTTMNDLFDPTTAETIRQRILRLHPASERQWGNMTLPQTLAHCTAGLRMAMGVINPKPAGFPANILGPLIKLLVFRDDKPMRRNSPSSPELFSANLTPDDVEHERTQLLTSINDFVDRGAACCSQHPHPFFGPLKPQQWAALIYKHLDHHLRQFGA